MKPARFLRHGGVILGLAFVASRIALDDFSAGADYDAAVCHCGGAWPVRAATEVSWPTLISLTSRCFFSASFLVAGLWHCEWRSRRLSADRLVGAFTRSALLLSCRRIADAATADDGSVIEQSPVAAFLMIFGTVGYDFSVGAFAVLIICPNSFAIGNLLLRRRAWFGVSTFCVLCLSARVPLLARRSGRWRAADMAGLSHCR